MPQTGPLPNDLPSGVQRNMPQVDGAYSLSQRYFLTYFVSGRISFALTSCASVWKPWFPSVTSGPSPDWRARGTMATRLSKSLKTRLIFTPGWLFSKSLESCPSTGSSPGSWLS